MSEKLHERVARAMSRTYMAGTLNTYEQILARLKVNYPTEMALREGVAPILLQLPAALRVRSIEEWCDWSDQHRDEQYYPDR